METRPTVTIHPRNGEFARISRLVEVLGGAGSVSGQAVGDDAAIVPGTDDRWVWTVDTQIEGVHFRFDWLDPEDVGHRALAAGASDLAAMAADPIGALVTAAGPLAAVDRLERIYSGIRTLGESIGCPVLGGDLARADGPLHLTVTALGRCPAEPVRRSGARPEDEVWVTGELGAPAAALAWLARDPGPDARLHPAHRRLARPVPRVEAALWLQERAPLRAMIDISDGLSGDAAHVARSSGVALHLEPDAIPVHPAAADIARILEADPQNWALHGGEEFELLVLAPPGALDRLSRAFADGFGIPLTRIGRVLPGEDVWITADGGIKRLAVRSWDHFGSTPAG